MSVALPPVTVRTPLLVGVKYPLASGVIASPSRERDVYVPDWNPETFFDEFCTLLIHPMKCALKPWGLLQ